MMIIKKNYADFIDIVTSRKLEIQTTQDRADVYHLIAKDGIVFYETFISKSDETTRSAFESVHLVNVKNKFTQTETTLEWDEIVTTLPTSDTELFTYKRNNIPVQTVLVTYEGSNKKTVMNVKKTRL